jgi:uncharacterized protein YecE (DUF72 family)
MGIWIGTSGYSYPEWRGSFYPEKFPTSQMLAYYAARFPTVEINNTFYRMPNEKLVGEWAAVTPERYQLTLKAPKSITHIARLRDCEDSTQRFLTVANTLGPKLGALLFQLPPFAKKDVAALDSFIATLPEGVRAAFEFRNPSRMDEEVFARLRARNLALCVADSEKFSTPVEITANYAYFRLRDEGYQPTDIEHWGGVIREKTSHCSDVYVYFKHEEQGIGPEFARILMGALGLPRSEAV